VLEAASSRFGSIAAVALEDEVSLYQNGLLVAASGHPMRAEGLVHLAMAQHPAPLSVLLIGGSVSGSLREVLKHPILRCDCVELDPMLLAMGRRFLPPEETRVLDDPRVTLYHTDGRFFVRTTPRRYDVVLLDLPGPSSAQLNRFYTVEFFHQVRYCLNPGGVLAFEIAASETALAPEQRLLLASLRETAKRVFPQIAVLPGDTCLFVLSAESSPLNDAAAIAARLNERGVERQFLHEEALASRLTPWRTAELERALAGEVDRATINSDFRPLGYLYDLAQWSAQFSGPLRRWLGAVLNLPRAWAYAIPLLVLPTFVAAQMLMARAATSRSTRSQTPSEGASLLRRGGRGLTVPVAVGVTGISEMVFQVTAIIAFPVLYGYLFYWLGLLVGAFMLGLAAGSLYLWRRSEMPSAPAWRWFVGVHVAILLYPLVMLLVFQQPPPPAVFLALPLTAGALAGLEFPLAVHLLRQTGQPVGHAAGLLYALDSLGAGLGALIVCPFLLPLLGLTGTCAWTVLLNAAVLALLFLPQGFRPHRHVTRAVT